MCICFFAAIGIAHYSPWEENVNQMGKRRRKEISNERGSASTFSQVASAPILIVILALAISMSPKSLFGLYMLRTDGAKGTPE